MSRNWIFAISARNYGPLEISFQFALVITVDFIKFLLNASEVHRELPNFTRKISNVAAKFVANTEV
jgi:hypothetical protein